MVVRQVFPGGSILAVVFANRAPGPLAEVGAPAFPVLLAVARLFQPPLFVIHLLHLVRKHVANPGNLAGIHRSTVRYL